MQVIILQECSQHPCSALRGVWRPSGGRCASTSGRNGGAAGGQESAVCLAAAQEHAAAEVVHQRQVPLPQLIYTLLP
jgi:hypothetical protein